MEHIAIIDYGMSNLHSVRRALAAVAGDDARVSVVTDRAGIETADKVVFPGQGAALDCMNALNAGNLAEAVLRAAKEKPFLGICMGLQVLLERSEENGGVACLGLFAGEVRRFSGQARPGHKIPQMGWNRVRQRPHPLWQGIADDSHFYFVHSYYTAPADQRLVAGTTDYGDNFASAVAGGFVFAVQFHPEKSAANGLRLLRNFIHWKGETC